MANHLEKRLAQQAYELIRSLDPGEKLTCMACHLITGKTKDGDPYGANPAWVARACGQNITIEVKGCILNKNL